MSLTKSEAIKQVSNTSVSNQYSLVKKLSGSQFNKQVKHTIPGGNSLTEMVSRESLPTALFTWLRRCRHFKDVLVSMCSDYSTREHKTSLVVEFNSTNRLPEWEIQGKKWLAERIADVLFMENVLAVKVERQGISVILDNNGDFGVSSDDWEPHLVFTPHKPTGF